MKITHDHRHTLNQFDSWLRSELSNRQIFTSKIEEDKNSEGSYLMDRGRMEIRFGDGSIKIYDLTMGTRKCLVVRSHEAFLEALMIASEWALRRHFINTFIKSTFNERPETDSKQPDSGDRETGEVGKDDKGEIRATSDEAWNKWYPISNTAISN